MNTLQQNTVGASWEAVKCTESRNLGARARAIVEGGMRRGARFAAPCLVESCAAARRGTMLTAGAVVSWSHAVTRDSGHGAARSAPPLPLGPALSAEESEKQSAAIAARDEAAALEADESAAIAAIVAGATAAAWAGLTPRLLSGARGSSSPARWWAAASRVVARRVESVRLDAVAVSGGGLLASVLVATGGGVISAIAAAAAEGEEIRRAAAAARISSRSPGGVARASEVRRINRRAREAEAMATAEAVAARAESRQRAKLAARRRSAWVASPDGRAAIAARVDAVGAVGPLLGPFRPLSHRVGDPLAAGIFRRATRRAESMADVWLLKHAAKFALPARERVTTEDGNVLRLRRSAWAEHSDGGGDDVGAGMQVADEVSLIYRHAHFVTVPLFIRWLKSPLLRSRPTDCGELSPRMRQDMVSRGWSRNPRRQSIDAIARQVSRRSARDAGKWLYVATGRDGRETLGWDAPADGVALSDVSEVAAAGLLRSAALSSILGEGEAVEAFGRRAPSSDPVAVANGGVGKRHGVEPAAWRVVARARAQALREHARAAKGGKGSGPVRKGAFALSATVHAVTLALRGQALPPEVAASLSAGPLGGMSSVWEDRLDRFRKAAGISVVPASPPAPDGPLVSSWRSGRGPLHGAADFPSAEDWAWFAGHLASVAAGE